ncbi:MAG: OmpA family protein [Paramuribaculum sp.]|nr:OmpA family protein [Paramuribaculum sp.]
MNKKAILGLVCAAFMGATATAQTQQEVTYVQDPSQGVLINKFKSNWFVTGEGGVNMLFDKWGSHRNFTDRWAPAASLYVGKWFSPIIGVRLGASFMRTKSLSEVAIYNTPGDYMPDGYYKQRRNLFGGVGDVMINLTNWWCGYKPGRIYNASAYIGGGAYVAFAKDFTEQSNGTFVDNGWKNCRAFTTSLRAGIINSFNVSDQVQLSLDIRAITLDQPVNSVQDNQKTNVDLQAFIGVTYLFNKRTWDAPIVPVCPEPTDCSAIEARLQAANARISDLQSQLDECLNRPIPECEECVPALSTIYYPIGVSRIGSREVNVLRSVAGVMKATPDQKYKITGWADNYTGSDAVNERLRHARANGVAKQLQRFGVPASQLEVGIDNNNLTSFGEKAVSLDRAVTIEVVK